MFFFNLIKKKFKIFYNYADSITNSEELLVKSL
jgi:hypothetical protein